MFFFKIKHFILLILSIIYIFYSCELCR